MNRTKTNAASVANEGVTCINDARLSLKVAGLLWWLLSQPDSWELSVKDIAKHFSDGEHSIYAGLRELKKHGYYKKEPVRNERGVITHWKSVVYDCPQETANESEVNS